MDQSTRVGVNFLQGLFGKSVGTELAPVRERLQAELPAVGYRWATMGGQGKPCPYG